MLQFAGHSAFFVTVTLTEGDCASRNSRSLLSLVLGESSVWGFHVDGVCEEQHSDVWQHVRVRRSGRARQSATTTTQADGEDVQLIQHAQQGRGGAVIP